jgi:squalene-hopene/tetraprenyl-beta-curcumene cyclase
MHVNTGKSGLRLVLGAALSVVVSLSALFQSTLAAEGRVGPDAATLAKMRQQAINFLRTSQADDGSWTSPQILGITAMAASALLESGVAADDPTLAKALKHLESYVQSDGGIYFPESSHRNYETCIAIMALTKANTDGRYNEKLAGAQRFLRDLQWDEGEGLESTDAYYGGAGYGGHKRPDLSNTQFFLDALQKAGVKSDDPAVQKALTFVSRTQNLETQYNNTPFAAKVNDGGFYYTPAAGGTSQAGTTPEGGLRSYGSMTYAGLKSMVYAGLTKDDPRVAAALGWIRKHYTLSENPGMGQQGLFYYYHTFAKTLDVLDVGLFEEENGKQHDWRKELAERLAEEQQSNGSWVNQADRWYEGDPNLATAYSLLALSYCDPRSNE